MKKLLITILLLGIFLVPAYANKEMKNNHDDGVVKTKSVYSVAETAQRFESIVQQQGLKVVTKVDHQAGAKSIGQELRPTQLIIFGNPVSGTLLMQCNQIAAIDLPQKALIWADEKGQVWLGYNNPRYLMSRHHLKGCGEVIQKIDNTLSILARKATQ